MSGATNVLPAPVIGPPDDADPPLESALLEEPHAATPSAIAPQDATASIDLREITSGSPSCVVEGRVPARDRPPVTGPWPNCEQVVNSGRRARFRYSGHSVVGCISRRSARDPPQRRVARLRLHGLR